jgi:hypothetical protein
VSRCRKAAAADLGDRPLYCVLQSEVGESTGGSLWGFYDCDSDVVYRDAIPDWRGRGPCIFIDDTRLSEGCDPRVFAPLFFNVVFHEFCHWIEDWQETPPPPSRKRIEQKSKLFSRALANATTTTKLQADPWVWHGLPFLRSCIHLAYRLRRIGENVTPAGLLVGNSYGLSRIETYARALDREPRRMRRLPIHRALTLPAPVQFQQLFAGDVARWHERGSSGREATPPRS